MASGLSSLVSFFKKDIPGTSPSAGVVGIDLGSSAIKIVQLKEVKDVPTLVTYGELQLGPYEGSDVGRSTRLPKHKLIEALIDILRESSVTGKEATFALSYSSSFTSSILVPTADPEQIESMIPVEARKYIPTSLNKVALDWILLGISETEKMSNVLVSAVYTEERERYNAIIRGAGLEAIASEIETFSSIRSVISPKDETVAIIDLGASAARLYIVEKGLVRKTHSIPLSGAEITRGLERDLKITFVEAEELKRIVGLLGKVDDERIQKSVINSISRGFRELHTVLSRYVDSGGFAVQKVIMSGGGALLQGVVPYIGDMFSMPVEPADPFAKVAYPAFLEDTLKEAGPSFAVAVGAALRGFQNRK